LRTITREEAPVKTFDKVLGFVTEKMSYVASVAIVAVVALVVTDIVRRSLGLGLILGIVEVVELIAAVILSMGIGYLTFVKGHVAVGLLVERFRPRVQAVFELVTSAIALAFGSLLARGLFDFGMLNQRQGWVTGSLQIPRHPFIYVVGGSMALMGVVLVRDLVQAVIKLRKGGAA
jgi:TRAP-type C4-dicarboxylate transport system permease small subunit